MPSLLIVTTPLWTFSRFPPAAKQILKRAASTTNTSPLKILRPVATHNEHVADISRRSGNYPPSLWDDNYIQSLKTVYSEEIHTSRAEKLKENVRLMLEKASETLDQLKLIDDLQRLGLSYHFEDVIEKVLRNIYINCASDHGDLFATALEFRLHRQQGFHVPQEVFGKFIDETGNFNPSFSTDTKGLLSLYEASYLSYPGESLLDDARVFAARQLVENLNRNMDELLAIQVSHALEFPLHWRMLRHESRWFIEVYEKRTDMNPILLELAKLDFNMVQATHQNDLKVTSRWWRKRGLGEKLPFARDRLVENFFWTVGVIFEPQHGYCRRMLTKIISLVTTIDDVYDVYGTLDELMLFTEVVERWDINLMEQLPDYMKLCFLAVFNSTNEMAYDALTEQAGFDVISYLKKGWADYCKAGLVEAKWYDSGYIPTLDEYLNNALVSISAPLIFVHIYFFVTKPFTKDALQCLERCPSIFRWSSMIVRLSDDLGTSSNELKRGDVPKSIQCYMHETGASEEHAREYIRNLIGETWKKLNEDRFADSPFSPTFIGTAISSARMAQFVYQHGDGHGISHRMTKDHVLKLVIKPIHP